MNSSQAVIADPKRRRRALVLTYVFPPLGWVGVHRTLKYCRYLPESNWTTTVVTARPKRNTFLDEKLLAQVPADVRVYRTWDFDPAHIEAKLAEWKLRRVRAKLSAEVAAVAATGKVSTQTVKEGGPRKGIVGSIVRFIKEVSKNSPDSHIFWVPFAFTASMWAMLVKRIDVIYTTSPPHSTHVAGLLLAKIFRKPLVVDFRDPWNVIGSTGKPMQSLPFLMRLAAWTKRKLIHTAARVITVSPGERAEMLREYPDIDPAKVVVINNGFDSSDEPPATPETRAAGDKLTLLHAGTIYPGIGGELFEALADIVNRRPEIAKHLHVDLIGDVDWEYMRPIAGLEAAGVLKSHGLVPHAQALAMMKHSEVLLLLLGGRTFRSSHLPSKAYEYLAAGKPILAVVPEGDLTRILRDSGLGMMVEPNAPEKLSARLVELVEAHQRGALLAQPVPGYKDQFERRTLAAKLATVLDTVVAESAARN
jgi:glycosyltransferase involved in cell wall biosynthesis